MSAPVAEATELETATPSLPRRLLDTFFSPGRMGRAVADDPRWAGALLVALALVALSSALLPPEMFAEVQRRAALERGVTPPPMTEDTLRIIRIFSIIGAPVAVAIITFVFAGLYTFVFAFVLGDQGRYRQYLALTAHAGFIPALLSLPLVPLRIQTGDPQFGLNLASFLFFLEPGYVLNVVRMLDLTQLWAMAVTALGVHQIDPRRGFASAFAVLFSFMLVVALIVGRFLPT
ncbi:MAG: YIP1 family protein [Gemmatimonadales bacterium]